MKARRNFESDLKDAGQLKISTPDVRNTISGLLRCHSIVLHEAASIFYGKNHFVFAGCWTWETVATWLESIGPLNRIFLTSIELWQHQPSHAWQMATGERVKVMAFGDEILEASFPRNFHLHRLAESTSQGLVETIDPAIERAFELLGDNRLSKLLLTVTLRQSLIPGTEIGLALDWDFESEAWFTMDLPNVMEKLRTIYTVSSVDVVWKGDRENEDFFERREQIQTHWTILELEEFDRSNIYWPARCVQFTLKRKELPELLLAGEPAPYSGWGYFRIQDVSNPEQSVEVYF